MKNYSHLKKEDLHNYILKNKSKFMDLKKKVFVPKVKKPKVHTLDKKPLPTMSSQEKNKLRKEAWEKAKKKVAEAKKPKAKKVGKVKLKPKTPPKPKSPPKTMPLAAKMAIQKFTGEKMDFEKRNVKVSDTDYFTNKVKTLTINAMKKDIYSRELFQTLGYHEIKNSGNVIFLEKKIT